MSLFERGKGALVREDADGRDAMPAAPRPQRRDAAARVTVRVGQQHHVDALDRFGLAGEVARGVDHDARTTVVDEHGALAPSGAASPRRPSRRAGSEEDEARTHGPNRSRPLRRCLLVRRHVGPVGAPVDRPGGLALADRRPAGGARRFGVPGRRNRAFGQVHDDGLAAALAEHDHLRFVRHKYRA